MPLLLMPCVYIYICIYSVYIFYAGRYMLTCTCMYHKIRYLNPVASVSPHIVSLSQSAAWQVNMNEGLKSSERYEEEAGG